MGGLALSSCREDLRFTTWPELAASTLSVVVSAECDGALGVRIMPRDAFGTNPLRLEDCETAVVNVLEYDAPPESFGLEPGPLEPNDGSACGILPLPPAAVGHLAEWREGDSVGFEDVSPTAPRLGALAAFRTQQLCPCRPPTLLTNLAIESAPQIAVQPIDDHSALVFSNEDARLEVYRTELESLELLETATISFDPNGSADGTISGLSDAARGPSGTYYLAADLGVIYRYDLENGLSYFDTVPDRREIQKMAASPEAEPWALYVLTDDNEILRLDAEGWLRYPYQSPVWSDSSQRSAVVWIGRDRVLVVPRSGTELVFLEGNRLERADWTEMGSIHAASMTTRLGLVAGTRRTTVFQLDADHPGTWTELIGPNGAPIPPTGAWFMQIHPTDRGFVAALEGPDSIISFDARWGFCERVEIMNDDMTMTRSAKVGQKLLIAGGRRTRGPIDGPVLMPVYGID